MSEGFLRALYGGRYEAHSAGTEPTKVDPRAVQVMHEAGIDIGTHRSKSVDEFRDLEFEYVVTVCDHAKEACPFLPDARIQLHRSFTHPWGFKGTEEEVLRSFRSLRDEIRSWIEGTFGGENEK